MSYGAVDTKSLLDIALEGQIAEAVNSQVRQTELTRVATSASSLVATCILLTTLGIRCFNGIDRFTWVARRVCTPWNQFI